MSLTKATVTRVQVVGMGDRVCVDLCSLMRPGEGLLVCFVFSSIICSLHDLLFVRIYVGIFSVKIGLVVNLGLVVEKVSSWWFENLVQSERQNTLFATTFAEWSNEITLQISKMSRQYAAFRSHSKGIRTRSSRSSKIKFQWTPFAATFVSSLNKA